MLLTLILILSNLLQIKSYRVYAYPIYSNPYGYHSGFFQASDSSFENRRVLFKKLGFDTILPNPNINDAGGYDQLTLSRYEDNIILPYSDQWLAEQVKAKRNFIATYLTVTTHFDYIPPEHFKTKKYSDNTDFNNYLNDQRYIDGYIRKLIAQYAKYHLLDKTIFIFMGDHGEGFGEHGLYHHNDVIYQEGLHIPFFIYAPGLKLFPRHLTGNFNQFDIMPTILELLKYKPLAGSFTGISILAPQTKAHPLYASCFVSPCVSVTENNIKYIYYFDGRRPELYNLHSDPHEKHNLWVTNSELAKHYRNNVLSWRSNAIDMYKTDN